MVRHRLRRMLSSEGSFETLVPGLPNWQLLIGVNVAIFFLFFFASAASEGAADWLVSIFALTPSLAFSQPWTLFTSMFLHAGLMHLFFNMFALWMFGMVVEFKVGSRNFLLLYFATGLVGSLAYLLTSWGSSVPGLGASGAIYGIMGAVAILEPHLTVLMMGFFPMPMWAAAFFWAGMEFFGFFYGSGGIGYAAHLGGLFSGLAIAYFLKRQALSFAENYDYQEIY